MIKLKNDEKKLLLHFHLSFNEKAERYLTFDSQGMSLDKKFEEILQRIFFHIYTLSDIFSSSNIC